METKSTEIQMYTRGSLKIDIVTSEPIVTASGDFSIIVNITNPYDVPITLYAVQTHMPVELVDSIWVDKLYAAERSAQLAKIENGQGVRRLIATGEYWWLRLVQTLRVPTSPRIAEAYNLESEKPLIAAPTQSQYTHVDGNMVNSTIGHLSPFSEFDGLPVSS